MYGVVDINEHGMIELTDSKRLYKISRNEDFYPAQYESKVLDDRLDEFKKSGKFFTKKYMQNTYLQLFTDGEYSFALDLEDGKLSFIKNDYIEIYIPAEDIVQSLLTEDETDDDERE